MPISGHCLAPIWPGLRNGAVRCAEGAANEHQLMALFGGATTKQAPLYTRKVNRARLEAEDAPLLPETGGSPQVERWTALPQWMSP